MPKFHVTGIFTASKPLGVFEADTEAEAIEMALNSDANHASQCHQCAREFELDDYCAHTAIASKEDE